MSQEVQSSDASTSTTAKDAVDTAKAEALNTQSLGDISEVEEALKFEELHKEKSIPYGVFKERNQALREAQKELKRLKESRDQEIAQALKARELEIKMEYESQLRMLAQKDPYDLQTPYEEKKEVTSPYIEKLEKELAMLKGEVEQTKSEYSRDRLKREVERLSTVYPYMDEQHVYAIMKANKDWDMDMAAEYSHKHFEGRTKSLYEKMIEEKKTAAKRKVIGADDLKNMKPEERPKSWDELRAVMKKYI